MFSIFVGVGHRSAIYYNITNLREKYSTVKINDLKSVSDDDDGVEEDLFISTVVGNSVESNYDAVSVENDVIDRIDSGSVGEEFYLESVDSMTEEAERVIESLERDNKANYLQQNVLAHSFNILSGKVKKLCFEKIFAEFFSDLINSKVSERILIKHSPTLIEIMNLTTIDPDLVDDEEANNSVYKLFRDWIKEKIEDKLYKYNIRLTDDMDEFKKQQLLEIVKRENNMIKYMKENKRDFIKKLLEFRNSCINFKT
jgi:hypothetical protein